MRSIRSCYCYPYHSLADYLVLAVKVFKPETYKIKLDSQDLARETLMKIVQYKKEKLNQAYLMLLSGFITLNGAIFYDLKYLSMPTS